MNADSSYFVSPSAKCHTRNASDPYKALCGLSWSPRSDRWRDIRPDAEFMCKLCLRAEARAAAVALPEDGE